MVCEYKAIWKATWRYHLGLSLDPLEKTLYLLMNQKLLHLPDHVIICFFLSIFVLYFNNSGWVAKHTYCDTWCQTGVSILAGKSEMQSWKNKMQSFYCIVQVNLCATGTLTCLYQSSYWYTTRMKRPNLRIQSDTGTF